MEPQSTPNTQIGACQDRLDALSKQIIGCAVTVMRTLGTGFLEKVYENALVHELRKAGITVAQQHRMVVRYNDVVVGDYTVDLLVENIVLVELKVAGAIDDIHRAQCLNYLKATGLRLCLLLNFGRLRLEIQRKWSGTSQALLRTLRVWRALRFPIDRTINIGRPRSRETGPRHA